MTAHIRTSRRATMIGVSALALTGGAVRAQTPKKGGTLTFLMTSEPNTLVALTTTATTSLTVSAKTTEGLLEYDYDINPKPALATEWSISPDGKTYTFKLRPNVKFHDGKPFTSADVAHSIQLLKTVHPRGRNTFANVTEVKTPDPLTAIIELSKPAPYLIKALTAAESPMIPKHLYESGSPMGNPNGNAPVGTGPYLFKEWVRGSHVIFERNPNYWDPDLPRIDRMVCKFVTDPGARSVAFENGSGDIGYRTPVALADVARLKKVPHLVFSTDGTSYSYNVQCIQFNLDSEYFKHLAVRRAIAHAIDRAALLKTVAYGYGTVCYVPIAAGLKEFHDPTPSPYKYDLKRAEQLLDEAGFKRGSDKIRFKVPMDYNPIGDDGRKTCEFVRASLSRIGIAVEVRAQDLSAFAKRIYTDRDFDFTYNGHSNLFDPTVGVQRIYWSKNFKKGVPFSNGSHYVNPKVDELLEGAAVENDPVKRRAMFMEFQKIYAEDVPDLSLYTPLYLTLKNKRVHEDSPTADGVESNMSRVWLDA
ncbi:MAG: ABC transporter substrate-binding protein [Enhydrobacter sp.]|nr:ABC transporter substrate-binding protein [Enhydrobacter sp.]